jgi:hypothetical protein
MTPQAPVLDKSLHAWGTAAFAQVLQQEIRKLSVDVLPLQAGLTYGSFACDRVDAVTLLAMEETADAVIARAGLHYAGIIAGCSCADDPTPNNETNEYCEVRIEIDRQSAAARISLIP